MTDDRRREPRLPAEQVKARVKFTDRRQFEECFLKDISRGGIFLRTFTPAPQGAPIEVTLVLPDGSEVALHGIVVHRITLEEARPGQHAGIGVQFEDLTPSVRSELEALLDGLPEQPEGAAGPGPTFAPFPPPEHGSRDQPPRGASPPAPPPVAEPTRRTTGCIPVVPPPPLPESARRTTGCVPVTPAPPPPVAAPTRRTTGCVPVTVSPEPSRRSPTPSYGVLPSGLPGMEPPRRVSTASMAASLPRAAGAVPPPLPAEESQPVVIAAPTGRGRAPTLQGVPAVAAVAAASRAALDSQRRLLWRFADASRLFGRNYYDIIGLPVTASTIEIQAACESLRRAFDVEHPPAGMSREMSDAVVGVIRVLDEIENCLCDAARRASYDRDNRR